MKPWQHFKTITKHRMLVLNGCVRVGLIWQGLTHDLSKYSPVEFWTGAKFYQGVRSPNTAEREQKGYSEAWMHHKGRNRHHFEYWTDYSPETGVYGPVKMPMRYVKEMFCDRLAASKIYQGDKYTDSHPIEYFERGRKNRLIHPETSDFLEKLLIMLRDEGEEKTFEYIRKLEDY